MNNNFVKAAGVCDAFSRAPLRRRKYFLQRSSIRKGANPHSLGLLAAWIGFLVVICVAPIGAYADSPATLTTPYSFTPDVGQPVGPIVLGTDGNFYGVSSYNGPGTTAFRNFFKITPSGIETTLYAFTDEQDRGPPLLYQDNSSLVQGSDGNFYGVSGTYQGEDGYIYQVTPTGTLTKLHTFDHQNSPSGTLAQGSDGNFYGVTQFGGDAGAGTVFKMTPSGMLTTLYSFPDAGPGIVPNSPIAGLVQGSDGNFYGSTSGPLLGNSGTIFRIAPTGLLTTLHEFSAGPSTDGGNPQVALVQGRDGNFYGSTSSVAGNIFSATVFKITPSGKFTTLHSFGAGGSQAAVSRLVVGNDGNLYGTTGSGFGTIFQITPNGTFTTLASFNNGGNGSQPLGVRQAADGNFYGVTLNGTNSGSDGLFFKLSLSATTPPPPQAQLIDPIPLPGSPTSSMLSAGAISADPSILGGNGRGVSGVSADGVTQVVVRIPASSVGQRFSLTLTDPTEAGASFIDDDGGLVATGTDPLSTPEKLGTTLTVTAVETNPSGTGGSTPMAFAIYRAPVDFARPQTLTTTAAKANYVLRAGATGAITGGDADLALRTVNLKITDGTGASGTIGIAIVRPPVVLVHGFAVDAASTWNDFIPLVSDKTTFSVFKVDYGMKLYESTQNRSGGFDFEPTTDIDIKSTAPGYDRLLFYTEARLSDLGFSYSTQIVASQILDIIDTFATGSNIIKKPVAAVSADIVGHSMGGLVARNWTTLSDYMSPHNYGHGYVHKLITLGTPHFGTPQAILSLSGQSACSRNKAAENGRVAIGTATLTSGATISGAAYELSGSGIGGSNMSVALQTVNAQKLTIPTATIAGDVTSIESEIDTAALSNLAFVICGVGDNDALASRYTSQLFDTIFDPEITPTNLKGGGGGRHSDGAVPLTSALKNPTILDVSQCSTGQCFSGYAHGHGTSRFFSLLKTINYLTDDSQNVALRVEDLLNTSISDSDAWK